MWLLPRIVLVTELPIDKKRDVLRGQLIQKIAWLLLSEKGTNSQVTGFAGDCTRPKKGNYGLSFAIQQFTAEKYASQREFPKAADPGGGKMGRGNLIWPNRPCPLKG
jgi:hypothetical protein